MRIKLTLALTVAVLGTYAEAANLILNGNFESGNTSGWTAVSTPTYTTTGSCNNSFAAQTTAAGCIAGLNPVSGSYAAYSSTGLCCQNPSNSNYGGQWINQLSQDFLAPTGPLSSAILSWSDSAVWTQSPSGLTGIDVVVNLLMDSSLVANQYSVSNPSTSGQEAWTNHSWDVTSFLAANPGHTFTVQLETFVSNCCYGAPVQASLSAGFDNVALNTSSATPEPATIGLTGLALVAISLARRRRS